MVTDNQVRRLMDQLRHHGRISVAAAQAGMDEKTARKYRGIGKLPSESPVSHTWRTRPDPFAEVWEELAAQLTAHPGLQAQTLLADLQRTSDSL